MKKTGLIVSGLIFALFFLGCAEVEPPTTLSSKGKVQNIQPAPKALGDAPGHYQAAQVLGDYRGYPALDRFMDRMVQKHGFTRPYLCGLFSNAKRKTWTIEYMNREKPQTRPKPGGWTRYRAKFLDDRHMNAGVSFGSRYAAALSRAEAEYGVPPEVILGILGVETIYGANVGNHRVFDALTTLAFDYPRRSDYFSEELENLLLMAREEGFDPVQPVGSFAGAMGLGQFMPGSFLKYAVDFDGDGRRDLWDPEDAIGSIAHYFHSFGWREGALVEVKAETRGSGEALKDGFETRYSLKELQNAGIRPAVAVSEREGPFSFLKLSTQQGEDDRIGFPNFYVITRYNHSTYYAMAVHELGRAIRRLREGRS